MIQLSAISGDANSDAFRRQRAGAARYRRQCGSPLSGVSLVIFGDETLDAFVYDDPSVSLICRGDLLPTDDGVRIDLARPAQSLAQLYGLHGDSFVTRLRGSFAIVLYDKIHRSLKAWTDHFGI